MRRNGKPRTERDVNLPTRNLPTKRGPFVADGFNGFTRYHSDGESVRDIQATPKANKVILHSRPPYGHPHSVILSGNVV